MWKTHHTFWKKLTFSWGQNLYSMTLAIATFQSFYVVMLPNYWLQIPWFFSCQIIAHSWGFLVWPLHKGMEGFPSPFGSLKAILWDWSYFSVGLISLYAIPKNCAVIHFFGIAWSDFQSSRFVTWPICYSLLIKKKSSLEGNRTPVLWTRPACSTNWAIEGWLKWVL